MSTDISRALGLGSEFTFRDKGYRLKPWSYKIQGAYELYLKEEAKRTVKEMRSICTDMEYKDLMLSLSRDMAAGYYAFGGEAVRRSMEALPHAQQLFFLMLRENHPEVTLDLVREMFQEKMEEMMEKIAEANDDPNPPTPA